MMQMYIYILKRWHAHPGHDILCHLAYILEPGHTTDVCVQNWACMCWSITRVARQMAVVWEGWLDPHMMQQWAESASKYMLLLLQVYWDRRFGEGLQVKWQCICLSRCQLRGTHEMRIGMIAMSALSCVSLYKCSPPWASVCDACGIIVLTSSLWLLFVGAAVYADLQDTAQQEDSATWQSQDSPRAGTLTITVSIWTRATAM